MIEMTLPSYASGQCVNPGTGYRAVIRGDARVWKVLRSGRLHVVVPDAGAAGGHVAMTVLPQEGIGAIVWAGTLSPHAVGKLAESIEMHDYIERQTTSFSSWAMLWPYYEDQPRFAPLLVQLRNQVDARLGALAGSPAQPMG